MSSNKVVREELERMYGRNCMLHEGLKIKGYKKTIAKYKGKSIANQLTLHHIKPKSQGGKATIENGAVLCRACHDFLEQSRPETKRRLNELLQEYKRAKIELVDDLELPFEIKYTEISVDDKPKKRKVSKAQKKRELRAQRKKEKKELQKLKREWEDR